MATGSQTQQGVVRVPLGTWNIDPTHSASGSRSST